MSIIELLARAAIVLVEAVKKHIEGGGEVTLDEAQALFEATDALCELREKSRGLK